MTKSPSSPRCSLTLLIIGLAAAGLHTRGSIEPRFAASSVIDAQKQETASALFLPIETEPSEPVAIAAPQSEAPDPDAPEAERQVERTAVAAPRPAYSTPRALAQPTTVVPVQGVSPPFSAGEIASMTPEQVRQAISQVTRSRRIAGLDSATQNRLREEFDALRARQGQLP